MSPLLEGEIGSAFDMTEPYAASSDPTNLETRIERDGEEFVINGVANGSPPTALIADANC